MKKIAKVILAIILVSCVPLNVFAVPKDCRKVTDPQIIELAMDEATRFVSSEVLWGEEGMHPDKDNVVFFVYLSAPIIWVAILNEKEDVCGVFVGSCSPFGGKSNISECIKAITNQSELTKYFKVSFEASSSGTNFMKDLEPKIRYWDEKKGKLYKEPHKGCEELLMYIRD
jgi:hypothetical protein